MSAQGGLCVAHVQSGYGASTVLFDVDLAVGRGEVVAVMGRNGMGKSTLIKTIMGELAVRKGTISFDGRDITGHPTYRIARYGIGWVPEGRRIFASLTVEENLLATARPRDGAVLWPLDRVYGLFPRLSERRATSGWQLSGGEQQMLAIGRALMTNPTVLILDEATEGLAPLMRAEIWRVLAELKTSGQSILIIDKNLKALSALADRHYIFEKGRVVWTGTSADLTASAGRVRRWIAV
jgi:branched-chain amino acid transport system ATP-binding protein